MAGERERDVEEETRNQMMQNLFGDQSEDEAEAEAEAEEPEEEEEEDDRRHMAVAAAPAEEDDEDNMDRRSHHSGYQSEEGEGEAENDGEGGGEVEGEGESEGQGAIEEESEGEVHQGDLDRGESDGEKLQSSPEREELGDQRMQGDTKDMDSEDEGYGQRMVTSRRREVVASESEGSEDNSYADWVREDEEADHTGKSSRPLEEERDHEVVRDVFGDSDEDEPAPYGAQNEVEEDSHRSPMEDEGHYEKELRPEDIVGDEEMPYESDENLEQKPKEKPVGPPLDLVFPYQLPPAQPDRMNVIKVSNIMGIEPKPFDRKTDGSGSKKKIRLEDNIVRWRNVRHADGTVSRESNARFVKWKDGSIQLLIGNEVLDISVHESNLDHSHLFLRHGKGVLQSQGRLLRKMRFMPSSLSSKSHRLLTALVESRNKKTTKVKNCVTAIDPEREKEDRERSVGQNIRAHSLLQRKKEKVNRKYTQPVRQRRQLSPGFLDDALDEDEETEDRYNSRRAPSRSRFDDDLEAEVLAERHTTNAKKSNMSKTVPRKQSFPPARQQRRPVDEYSESEREESEYETEGEDIENSPTNGREDELDNEDEYEEDAEEEAERADSMSDEEIVERKRKRESGGPGQRRREIETDEESPPRKQPVQRRKAVVFDSDEE